MWLALLIGVAPCADRGERIGLGAFAVTEGLALGALGAGMTAGDNPALAVGFVAGGLVLGASGIVLAALWDCPPKSLPTMAAAGALLGTSTAILLTVDSNQNNLKHDNPSTNALAANLVATAFFSALSALEPEHTGTILPGYGLGVMLGLSTGQRPLVGAVSGLGLGLLAHFIDAKLRWGAATWYAIAGFAVLGGLVGVTAGGYYSYKTRDPNCDCGYSSTPVYVGLVAGELVGAAGGALLFGREEVAPAPGGLALRF